MADRCIPAARSRNMSAIRGADTRPELAVRRMLHAAAYRFRLHRKDLPGRPDIVFPSRRRVIFIHGCFWHRHPGCRYAYMPTTSAAFWREKLSPQDRPPESWRGSARLGYLRRMRRNIAGFSGGGLMPLRWTLLQPKRTHATFHSHLPSALFAKHAQARDITRTEPDDRTREPASQSLIGRTLLRPRRPTYTLPQD
jgi:DNA mismatch endonuclease Vsr